MRHFQLLNKIKIHLLIRMIKQLITKYSHNKLIRFFFVSGLNTAFGYSLYALLLYIGLHYTIAGLIGTIIGILFNFKTIGLIVFQNKNIKHIFRFIAVYVISYFLGIGSTALFLLFGINEYISGLIMLLPFGIIRYFLNKYFVFDSKKKSTI